MYRHFPLIPWLKISSTLLILAVSWGCGSRFKSNNPSPGTGTGGFADLSLEKGPGPAQIKGKKDDSVVFNKKAIDWKSAQQNSEGFLRRGLDLTGSGIGEPAVKVSTDRINFSSWPTEFASIVIPILLTNSGGPARLRLEKLPKAPFYVIADPCAQGVCAAKTVFYPQEPGVFSDEIVFRVSSPKGTTGPLLRVRVLAKAYDRKLFSAAGPGGGPALSIYNVRTKSKTAKFLGIPESRGGLGGIASADVTGDEIPDILVGSGQGTEPKVFVLDGLSDELKMEFQPFDASFTGGVRLAVGDVDGDKVGDVIAGAGPDGGPRVRVFSGKSKFSEILADFFAYDAQMRFGVYVACGDFNADWKSEVVTGPGEGGAPHLRVFDVVKGALLVNRFIGDEKSRGGLTVATGAFSPRGHTDLIVSSGNGMVEILQGASSKSLGLYQPFGGFTGPLRLSSAFLNADLTPDLIVGAGPGGGPRVMGLEPLANQILVNYFAFEPTFRGGVFVSGN